MSERRLIIGVDPGLDGGIVMLAPGASIQVEGMPTIKVGTRREYNAAAIADILDNWVTSDWYGDGASYDPAFHVRLVVESIHAMPLKLGGGIANFQRGLARGIWVGIAETMRLPQIWVAPQKWQREMLRGLPAGTTKQRSVLAARREYPHVELRAPGTTSRKPHEGIADALCIATWWLRQREGK